MVTKNQKIIKRLDEYDGYKDNKDRQNRLRNLVDEHGEECVALAAELTIGTLQQYLRVKTAMSVNENTVLKAERILEGI